MSSQEVNTQSHIYTRIRKHLGILLRSRPEWRQVGLSCSGEGREGKWEKEVRGEREEGERGGEGEAREGTKGRRGRGKGRVRHESK